MTAQTRQINKGRFEQGDTPQGSDFVDLIDSFLSVANTSAQTVASKANFSGGVATTTVSAVTVNTGDIVSNTSNVRTAIGIGTVAPAAGLHIVSSAEAAFKLDVVTTTKASGGTGGAVPTSAQGFLTVQINGTKFYVPFFNVKA